MDALPHLYTTNVAPSHAEVAVVQAAIQKLEAELARCRGILSPLRRLPLELLGEIFVIVLDTIARPTDVAPQVLKISLVCKTWRGAALGTPQLWNRLGISLVDFSDSQAPPFEEVGRWFRRAGTVPCSFTLYPIMDPHRDGDEHSKEHCSLLVPGLAEFLSAPGINIGYLYIGCKSENCLGWLSERVNSLNSSENRPWDAIRSFELTLESNPGRATPLLPHLPSAITSLALGFPVTEEGRGEEDAGTMNARLINLKDLTMTLSWSLRLEETILGLCRNLQNLTLIIYPANEAELEPGSLVMLPHLRRLRIEDVTGDPPILLYLRTPILQELDLEFNWDEFYSGMDVGFEVADELARFIKRSKCESSLSHLRLANVSVEDDSFGYLLGRLPPITHLTLDYFDVPSEFFLGNDEDKFKLLPRLEVLEWFSVSEDPHYEHVCLFFAKRFKRNYSVQALKRLKMEYQHSAQLTPLKDTLVLDLLKKLKVDVEVSQRSTWS